MLAWSASAASDSGAAAWFASLVQPALPSWAGLLRLSAVGLATYLISAVGAWLVWRRMDVAAYRKRLALQLWGWQLLANALWPSLLFGFRSTAASLGAATVALAAVLATVGTFWRLQRGAAVLLLPRLVCTAFVAYLLFQVWSLNPG